MRGLKTDRGARIIVHGHAFVQNLRRGHYELATEARPGQRVDLAVMRSRDIAQSRAPVWNAWSYSSAPRAVRADAMAARWWAHALPARYSAVSSPTP